MTERGTQHDSKKTYINCSNYVHDRFCRDLCVLLYCIWNRTWMYRRWLSDMLPDRNIWKRTEKYRFGSCGGSSGSCVRVRIMCSGGEECRNHICTDSGIIACKTFELSKDRIQGRSLFLQMHSNYCCTLVFLYLFLSSYEIRRLFYEKIQQWRLL